MKIGDVTRNIRKARKNANLSQERMSELLGISRQAYNHVEMGKTVLISKHLFEIAQILNISVENLLLGDDFEHNLDYMSEQLHKKTDKLIKSENEKLALKTKLEDMEEVIISQRDHIATLKALQNFLFHQAK